MNFGNLRASFIIRSDDFKLNFLPNSVPVKFLQNLQSSRILTGCLILVSSLIIANAYLKNIGQTEQVWRSISDLAPGAVIDESDLKSTSVLLPQNRSSYISTKQIIVGAMVTRKITQNELIPIDSISEDRFALNFRDVPLAVEISDVPLDLRRGHIVDIYSIPNRETKSYKSIESVISQVTVAQVSDRANSLKAQVLVAIPIDQVESLLKHLADARILIVRSDP